jgi:hypothetical protein
MTRPTERGSTVPIGLLGLLLLVAALCLFLYSFDLLHGSWSAGWEIRPVASARHLSDGELLVSVALPALLAPVGAGLACAALRRWYRHRRFWLVVGALAIVGAGVLGVQVLRHDPLHAVVFHDPEVVYALRMKLTGPWDRT